MTIVNHPSDGLYPELIVLFRAVASYGPVANDDLIRICSTDSPTRLRAALSRWTQLGLFYQDGDGSVRLSAPFTRKRGESVDDLTQRMPGFCRALVLEPAHCLPLWGEDAGVAADFVRGIAWLLAQDIYGFPTVWPEVEAVEQRQAPSGRAIVQNDTRWSGLRFWGRYLGFGSGDASSFLVDPTNAISAELPAVFAERQVLPALDFITALHTRLPVLDFGTYRAEVESGLNEEAWRRPPAEHLSMSLSLALRRLQLANVIALDSQADASQGFALTGRNYRSWSRFSHVRLTKPSI